MSQKTTIQYSDTTGSPVMGCDGCELYPTSGQVRSAIHLELARHGPIRPETLDAISRTLTDGPQAFYSRREANCLALIGTTHTVAVGDRSRLANELREAVEKLFICYASKIHRVFNARGGNSGYAYPFEEPRMFTGRLQKISSMPIPSAKERAEKPWMEGLPRVIFISDMGDALSNDVPYDFLKSEIIDPVSSAAGSNHIWLWLSKRPRRMAEFGRWLAKRGISWPDNLVAMTSITSAKNVDRARQLLNVPARYRGLSIEPLWERVSIPLDGISWVVVGGESGAHAHQFELEWAESLLSDCRKADVAFFMKQMGRRPTIGSLPLKLKDTHGGDWEEWPSNRLRERKFPSPWYTHLARNPATHAIVSSETQLTK